MSSERTSSRWFRRGYFLRKTSSHSQTDMGSGAWPSSGANQAASIRGMQYKNTSGVLVSATFNSPSVTASNCDDYSYTNVPGWGDVVFYGGRGSRSVFARDALALLACLASVGCSSDDVATNKQQAPPSATAAGGAAPVPGDASYVEGQGYQQGVYQCCAQGEGRSCCDQTAAKCFEYGGPSGGCKAEGETVEAKEICSHCCAGLTRAAITAPSAPTGECGPVGPASLFVCVYCGDGVCSADENVCNCADDCL